MISYIKFANSTSFIDINPTEVKTFKEASNVLLHVADRCFYDRLESESSIELQDSILLL